MSPQPSLSVLRSQSDERLVQLARAGHERAFEAIVERYRRPLYRWCRRVLPEGRAEDALQQALLAAWTALERGDDVRELRPWLYRIVHRSALNALRISGYDYDELAESLQMASGSEEDLERRAIVREALAGMAALPDRQREALLRTALGGVSQDEVARDLGLSTGAVRQLVHRARVRLRAAATVLTPLPVATWLASAGTRAEPMAQRVGEPVVGGAGAGAAATLAKTGAAALVAGGLLGPAMVEHQAQREQRAPVAEHRAASRPRAKVAPAPSPAAARVVRRATSRPVAVRAAAPQRRVARSKKQHRAVVVRRSEPRQEVERTARDENERRDDAGDRPEDTQRDHGDREDSSGDEHQEAVREVPEASDEHDDGGAAVPAATPSDDEHDHGPDSDE